MKDDYLESIRKGQLPDELNTVWQRFRPDTFAALLTAFSYVFVEVHEEFRQRYAPAVPAEYLDADLNGWMYIHMKGVCDTIREKNPNFGDDDHEALRAMLSSHGSVILALFRELRDLPSDTGGDRGD